jgi:hypothetical protein
MDTQAAVQALEEAWDTAGFLGMVRTGCYVRAEGEKFLQLLRSIELQPDACIPGRLVALLWYLPSFLEWQKPRIAEKGGDVQSYARFVTEVHNHLEELLGVP